MSGRSFAYEHPTNKTSAVMNNPDTKIILEDREPRIVVGFVLRAPGRFLDPCCSLHVDILVSPLSYPDDGGYLSYRSGSGKADANGSQDGRYIAKSRRQRGNECISRNFYALVRRKRETHETLPNTDEEWWQTTNRHADDTPPALTSRLPQNFKPKG
jgi:hypothetical protein